MWPGKPALASGFVGPSAAAWLNLTQRKEIELLKQAAEAAVAPQGDHGVGLKSPTLTADNSWEVKHEN